MRAAEAKLEAQIATLPVAQIKVIRTLFYDVVAMIGTNPAIMLVKERLLHPRCVLSVPVMIKIRKVTYDREGYIYLSQDF